MSDPAKKIIIDEDWKQSAQQEKEELAAKLEAEKEQAARPAPVASFEVLVNSLAMPAMMNLGMIQIPNQPPELNLAEAKFYIDLLGVVEEKTKGNLENAEHNMLTTLLYELRMAFVTLAKHSQEGGASS